MTTTITITSEDAKIGALVGDIVKRETIPDSGSVREISLKALLATFDTKIVISVSKMASLVSIFHNFTRELC